jgi:NAD(P)-dependent dehydrogenase (short-subunit alcohol dehydrogenase family)
MDLDNKVVVITGAGSGIGRALAECFVSHGVRHVVCTDLDAASAAETAKIIGEKASSASLDVSSQSAIESLIEQTILNFGGIDVFISNAGYARSGGLKLPTDDWKKMMEVHTWSHLNAARAVIPHMIERGGGYLLNTASAAGLLTQIDSGAYAISKHAAVALAEWLAINYKNQGIGVSVLCPQAVRTNILGPKVMRAAKKSTGQASKDGVLEADAVAQDCINAILEERFLVLPHPEVATYFQNKANDYERWLNGMRRFRDRLLAAKNA